MEATKESEPILGGFTVFGMFYPVYMKVALLDKTLFIVFTASAG